MKRLMILICALFLSSCSKVETATNSVPINLEKTPTVSPTVQENVSLKPVTPKVALNSKQRKYLNESLPPKVREILEKAETFEILAEVKKENESDSLSFYPNRIAFITDETEKKEILEAFYYDASDGYYPSACYIPHHKIRATYQGKNVEIEICFDCSRFNVESPLGNFEGGIVRENRKSEDIFKRIVENKSVELKQ